MAENPVGICPNDGDSALAVTSSIAGILTLCFAISATTWFHVNSVRKADSEFKGLKTALDWYKKESEWVEGLAIAQADYHQARHKHRAGHRTRQQNPPAQLNGQSNGHSNGQASHNGALVQEPENTIEACDTELVNEAEEAVEAHEARFQRSSRRNSRNANANLEARARRNWHIVRRHVYRKNRFAKAANEEVLKRHKIVKERNMHRQLLEDIKTTDSQLSNLVNRLDPPLGRDADTTRNLRQSPDASERVSIRSNRRRLQSDEENALSHGDPFPQTHKLMKRIRLWYHQWNWYRVSKLCMKSLPVSKKYRRKMEIAMQWLPNRGEAMELQKKREALGTRVMFATLAMIGSKLSEQELRGSMHELLVRRLVDTSREVDRESDEGPRGHPQTNGQNGVAGT